MWTKDTVYFQKLLLEKTIAKICVSSQLNGLMGSLLCLPKSTSDNEEYLFKTGDRFFLKKKIHDTKHEQATLCS